MIKILLYGVMPEYNFGGPSLMHGAEGIIRELYDQPEIIFYQSTKPVDIAIDDMGFQIYQIPYNRSSEFLIDAVKYKLGIQPKVKERSIFLQHIKTSDIVANLSGICFCETFSKNKYSFISSIKSVIAQFAVSFVAKMYNKKTVKCTASFGPLSLRQNIIEARFAAKYIFDVICARENESKRQMQIEAGINKYMCVSPDLANYMTCPISESREVKYIGISISFQIIRQWNAEESYIECIVALIRHIIKTINYKILLIPNEITVDNNYNDMHVANEIYGLLDYSDTVYTPDVANMNSSQLKMLIASCEVMVSSRYHSCVAALSSGVPTFVVGWHYKYEELLHWYGQDKWILSNENCTSKSLITAFDELWENRNREREIIKRKYPEVLKALLESGKVMFTK